MRLYHQDSIRYDHYDSKLFSKTLDETTVSDLTINYFLSEMKIKLYASPRNISFLYSDFFRHSPEIRQR